MFTSPTILNEITLARPAPLSARQKTGRNPGVAAAKARRLKHEATIKRLKESAEREKRIQAMLKENAALAEQVSILRTETDRLAKGGFQSKIRVGQFAKGRFKVFGKT